MTEVEKIAYTRMYIEKLANGINPLTDQAVPDTDLINNVRISRCLFYSILPSGVSQLRIGATKKYWTTSMRCLTAPYC